MVDALSQLNIPGDLNDGDIITDVVMVLNVINPAGEPSIHIRVTEGTDAVTHAGLLALALPQALGLERIGE